MDGPGIEPMETKRYERPEVGLSGPLVFWICFLAFAIIVQIALSTPSVSGSIQQYSSLLSEVSNYILYLPGVFVFPLIVSLWIGERVGSVVEDAREAARVALVNAAYSAIVYTITIIVILLIIHASNVAALIGTDMLVTLAYAIVIPVTILLVLTTGFAALAYTRRAG